MSGTAAPAEAGSARPDTKKSRGPGPGRIPRHAFWKGAAAGLLLVVPTAALTVWAGARLGVLDQGAGVISCLRLAFVFAGLAAVVTGGGVGRLAAEASVTGKGGRVRAVVAASRAMAAGGAALTLIAAIPHGGLPETTAGWLALIGLGAVTGAGAGALIGLACSGELPTLQELGVWPPAEWPLPWPRDDEDERGGKAARGEPPARGDREPRP